MAEQMNTSGGIVTELRYHPWDNTHSQRHHADNAAIGLYFYNAHRRRCPALGRFIQADTIVPSPANPQSLNRYSYVLNNALKYTDPSGHAHWAGEDGDLTSIWAEYHNNGWSDYWSYGQVKAAYSSAQIAAAHAPDGHDPHAVFADTMADALQERGTADWGTTRFSALAWSYGDEWSDISAAEGGREQAMFVATNSLFTPGPAIAGSGADGGTFPGEEYQLVPPRYSRKAFGDWQHGVRSSVLDRDNYTCVYCGHTDRSYLTVDHVQSCREFWDQGGYKLSSTELTAWYNDTSNLVTACRSCNSSKGMLDVNDWLFGP